MLNYHDILAAPLGKGVFSLSTVKLSLVLLPRHFPRDTLPQTVSMIQSAFVCFKNSATVGSSPVPPLWHPKNFSSASCDSFSQNLYPRNSKP